MLCNRMARLNGLLALGAVLLLGSSPAGAQTEAKIAFINSEALFQEYQGFKDAEEAYQREFDTWMQELSQREDELRRLEAEFRAQEPMLSEERRLEKEQEFQRRTQEYEQYRLSIFGQSGRAQMRNQELLEPVLAQVQTAVEKVAEDNDYDLIFDAIDGNIIYGRTRYDITELVLAELRSGAPAEPGGGTAESSGSPGGGSN